jgi:hypothetical protein
MFSHNYSKPKTVKHTLHGIVTMYHKLQLRLCHYVWLMLQKMIYHWEIDISQYYMDMMWVLYSSVHYWRQEETLILQCGNLTFSHVWTCVRALLCMKILYFSILFIITTVLHGIFWHILYSISYCIPVTMISHHCQWKPRLMSCNNCLTCFCDITAQQNIIYCLLAVYTLFMCGRNNM